MANIRCFMPGCVLNVEYECPCSSPQTYCCKLHVVNHLEARSKTHTINSAFVEPYEEAREAILKFLAKADSKHQKMRKKLLASYSQHFFDRENDLEELIKEMDLHSAELSNCFTKISEAKKTSKSEQDPVLALLSLQPNNLPV